MGTGAQGTFFWRERSGSQTGWRWRGMGTHTKATWVRNQTAWGRTSTTVAQRLRHGFIHHHLNMSHVTTWWHNDNEIAVILLFLLLVWAYALGRSQWHGFLYDRVTGNTSQGLVHPCPNKRIWTSPSWELELNIWIEEVSPKQQRTIKDMESSKGLGTNQCLAF